MGRGKCVKAEVSRLKAQGSDTNAHGPMDQLRQKQANIG